MSKKINVFIDHFGIGRDEEFAKSLKARVLAISPIFNVRAFSDVEPYTGDELVECEIEAEDDERVEDGYEEIIAQGVDGNDVEEAIEGVDEYTDAEDEYWASATLEEVLSADILIPIVTARYLPFVDSKLEGAFNSAIDSEDKYLLPVMLSPVNWGKINWMVRGKLFPSEGRPISDLSETETDMVINDLVLTLEGILTELTSKSDKALVVQPAGNPLGQVSGSVFISHDHDDADFAELLKHKLEKEGVSGWIDSERLKIGQDWREEIDNGIESSLAVIVIVTPEARKSEYVTYEWAYAWGKGKVLFPLMLKQTQLHPRLESLQYLDFTNRAARPWDKLISSIKELL